MSRSKKLRTNDEEHSTIYQPPPIMNQQPTANSRFSNSEQPISNSCSSDEINVLEYLSIVYRYKWMIMAITIIAMAATVAMSLRQPRMYQAHTSIVPPIDRLPQGGLADKLGGAKSMLMKGVLNDQNLSGLYVGILESSAVSEALVDRFDLMSNYSTDETRIARTDARGILAGRTTIKASKEGIVHVSVTDQDPQRAAAIAIAYVDELDQQNKRLSGGQATSKRVFLEKRLIELQNDLSKIDNLQSREVETKEMLFELLNRECEMAKIEEAKSMPTIQVLDNALVPERPLGRGTTKKGVLAGVFAGMFGVLISFGLENISDLRRNQH